MTLVVARRTQSGRTVVVADMRVLDSDDIRRGYPFAALKNVILSPTVVVATAGNSALAMDTLRALPKRPCHQDEVLPSLLDSSRKAGSGQSAVSFVLAIPRAGLWRVTHAGVEPEPAVTWIGHQDAFRLYQRAYHDAPTPTIIRVPGVSPDGPSIADLDPGYFEVQSKMQSAIWSLQTNVSVESVGEAFVTANSTSEGFRYAPQAFRTADHEQVITSDQWVPADWGTLAEGGFGYDMLVPAETGVGLVGLYFPHAGLGLLYHPLSRDDAFAFREVSRRQFAERILDEHGVKLRG